MDGVREMRSGLLGAIIVLLSASIATDALACRIPRSGIVRTEAQQDVYALGMVDVAAIAVITRLSTAPDDFVSAEFRTRAGLRGEPPERFILGDNDGDGITDIVLVTCYRIGPVQGLVENLREGDEVLVFSSRIAPEIPFDVLKLDDPRAVRLLAILRSERTSAQ